MAEQEQVARAPVRVSKADASCFSGAARNFNSRTVLDESAVSQRFQRIGESEPDVVGLFADTHTGLSSYSDDATLTGRF